MKIQSKHCGRLAACVAVATLFGCSGGGDDGSGRSTLSVSLMDAPVDGVTAVYVKITRMAIKSSGGPAVELPLPNGVPLTVNLLSLTDTNAAILLDNVEIAPGSYEWLAMDIAAEPNVDDSYVLTETGLNEEIDLNVPSGRMRLVSGFDVGPNEAVRLLFDWDMRHGLVFPPGQNRYFLKPAFRMIDVTEYGVLRGTISPDTISVANGCDRNMDTALDKGNVVYLFAASTAPDDIDGTEDPVATIDATYDSVTGWTYRTLIEPGTYTVVFTCQGDADDNLVDESTTPNPIAFSSPVGGTTNPVVNLGGTTVVDF